MTWSEERIHRWLSRRKRPEVLAGSSGHDAAVLAPVKGRPVVCTDACAAGVHYAHGAPARAVGRKAAARSLSDLAATAARPHALILGLRAPKEASEARLRGLIDGVDRAGRSWGAALVAGDLCLAPGPECLTVTALGFVSASARPVGRDRGEAGDTLVLTGPVGGSLLGRHLRFEPRLAAGAWLAARGARAMQDVSDGLALDVFRLARASGLRATLDDVPIHADARRLSRQSGESALHHALHDGEDHELIAALPAPKLARLWREAPEHCPGLVAIGKLARGKGLVLEWPGEAPRRWSLRSGGWIHGT